MLNIKEIFKKTNLGFFLRNNFWVIISNKKEAMSENDLREYNKIDFSVIQLDKKIIPKQNQFSEYFGLGWTHNLANPGVWSEGYISTILFKVDPIYNENIFLEMEIEPALIGKNKPKFTIYINDVLEKTYDLNKDYDLNKIRLNLKKNINNVYKIDFKFSNIISPLEVLQSPDARKLGLLVKSLTLKKT